MWRMIGVILWTALLGLAATGPVQAQEHGVYLPAISRFLVADPAPAAGAAGQSPNTHLTWRFDAPTAANPSFTVLLEAGDATPDDVAGADLTRPGFDPPTLALDTTYYWQVLAQGEDGVSHSGPIWSFRTERLSDQPDLAAMVGVPAGEFVMGCDAAGAGADYTCPGWEQPLHKVWLDGYAIDKYEVTNVEYRACVAGGACDPPRRTNSHQRERYYDDDAYNLYPVLYVSRENAMEYCAWEGKRLPTEAEWEKAARGPIDTRPFPWGSEDTDCTRQHRPDGALCGEEGSPDTARVGLYWRGASPYGAYDMSGNVFEWTYDRFQEEWYRRSPYANPINPPSDEESRIVIRGGSYRDDFRYLTTYHRHIAHHGDFPGGDWPAYRNDRTGFRCVKPLP